MGKTTKRMTGTGQPYFISVTLDVEHLAQNMFFVFLGIYALEF